MTKKVHYRMIFNNVQSTTYLYMFDCDDECIYLHLEVNDSAGPLQLILVDTEQFQQLVPSTYIDGNR